MEFKQTTLAEMLAPVLHGTDLPEGYQATYLPALLNEYGISSPAFTPPEPYTNKFLPAGTKAWADYFHPGEPDWVPVLTYGCKEKPLLSTAMFIGVGARDGELKSLLLPLLSVKFLGSYVHIMLTARAWHNMLTSRPWHSMTASGV